MFKYPILLPIMDTMVEHYKPVKIPDPLLNEVDKIVEASPLFNTRAGFIRYVIQDYVHNNPIS